MISEKSSIFPARRWSVLCCVNQTCCTLRGAVGAVRLLSRVKMPPLVALVVATTPTASRAAAGCRSRKSRWAFINRKFWHMSSVFLSVCVKNKMKKLEFLLLFSWKNKTQTAKKNKNNTKSIVQMEEKLQISCCEICPVSTLHLLICNCWWYKKQKRIPWYYTITIWHIL